LGQTVFPIVFDYYAEVDVNGVRLTTAEYALNSGTSITLNTPATAGDIVKCIGYVNFDFTNAAGMTALYNTVVSKEALISPHYTQIDLLAADLTNIDTVSANITGILASSTNAANALTSEQNAAMWASKASNIAANGIIDDTTPSTVTTWSSQKVSNEFSTLKALALSGL